MRPPAPQPSMNWEGRWLLDIGYCPHTAPVYNRATITVLLYVYYEYYPTVTEWGQYPIWTALNILLISSFRACSF